MHRISSAHLCPSSPVAALFRWASLLHFRRRASRFDDDDYDSNRRHGRRKRKVAEGEGETEEERIYLHKSRGQHLLTNPRVLDSIVRKAGVRPTDTVLEIGPGTGNLTLRLLEAARRVIAVEIDSRMIQVLRARIAERSLDDRITVICQDALKTQFPEFDLCVANIPYGISSPLVVKLLYGGYAFRDATLLLQKEFARRLLAKPGDSEFNRLAVNVKLVANVDFVMDVSKRDFVPCPKVDSSVVRIEPKTEVPDVDIDEWLVFTRACFNKKNKTLGAIFKQKCRVRDLLETISAEPRKKAGGAEEAEEHEIEEEDDNEDGEGGGDGGEMCLLREKLVEVLREGGFEGKRPCKLSVEELLQLLARFNQAGICFHQRS